MDKQVLNFTDEDVVRLYKELGAIKRVEQHTGISHYILTKVLKLNNISTAKYVRKESLKHDILEVTPIILELFNSGETIKGIRRKTGINTLLISKVLKRNKVTVTKRDLLASKGLKECKLCRLDLTFDKFDNHKLGHLGLNPNCKNCRKIKEPYSSRKVYQESYRFNEENKKRKALLSIDYRKKIEDKIKALRKTPEYKARKKIADKKYREKIKDIPEKFIPRAVRSAVSGAVKYKRHDRTFNILGYTIHDLLNHLESKFTDGMTWDNYGRNGWHIDHIRPIASFIINSDEVLKEVWSLDNLQPMWETENCSKGSLYNGVRYRIAV